MKINFLPKKKAVWNTTYKAFHIVALIAVVFNMSSVGIFLTPNTASAAELTETTGAVCPDGNVKYNIDGGYEYDDGSATITGNGDSVAWNATNGYVITDVCIKIGGPDGGSLINPNPADGSAGPFDNDISHVVVTTGQDEETGNLRIKKYHDLNHDGSMNGADYYLKGWYFEVTQGGQPVGSGLTGEDGNYLIIEDLPVGDYQVTETQQPGWVNSEPGVNPITKTVTVVDENTTEYSNVWFGNYPVGGLNDLLSGEGVCYEDDWGYNTAAAGVGLENASTGSFDLNVPENLHKAYIFWGGRYEYEGSIPGDNQIKLNGTTVTADGANVEKGTNPSDWGWVGYYADVTGLVSVGNNSYTVSEVNVHSTQNDGAGILAVYRDSTKEPSEFAIKGGLDYAFHGFPTPMGSDTNVYTYTFEPAPYDRIADTSLLVGDGEAGNLRGDNLWFQSGTGSAPTNLVDQAGATEIAKNFMVQSDGPQWDTFSTTVTIPANATYASFQIESPEDEGTQSPYGESIALHAQSFVLGQDCPEEPGECELEVVKSVKNLTQQTEGTPDVSADPGDVLEYTLTYENIGDAECTGGGVQLFDDLDDRLTYNGVHTEDNDDHDITYYGHYNGSEPVANAHVVSPDEFGYVKFQAVVTEDLECGQTVIPNKYRIWSNETGNLWSNEVNVDIYKECYGSLKVKKFVDFGEATPDMWEFTVAGQGTQSPAQGENYVVFSQLPEGNYSATESTIPGYHQVSTTCDDVQVVAGEQAVCEFHNTKDTFCKMEFTKSVDKENAKPGDVLTYTLNYENLGDADCTGGGVQIYDDLDDRLSYVDKTLTGNEYNGNGDGITLYEVFDGSSPLANAHEVVPGESGVITFQAVITEDLECGETVIPNKAKMWSNETGFFWSNEVETTVYKECYGSLRVIKIVDEGDATPDMWDFTVAGHGTQSPAQGENNIVFSRLLAGNYSATESNMAGYHQVSTTCDDVQVVAGEQAVCVFHNTVDKYDFGGYKFEDINGNGEWDQGEPALEGWTINLVPNCSENFADYDLVVDGVINLSDLGKFAQLHGQQDLAVDLYPDGVINDKDSNCFKNAYGSTPNTLPTYSVKTDKNGHYEFTDMPYGIYQVCEENQTGWYQTYPSENKGCHYVLTGPNTDTHETNYNFGNTEEGKITGYKFEDLNVNGQWDKDEPGLPNWTIELESSCSETFADYDLIADDVINLSDLGMFAQLYGQKDLAVDMNSDGLVNNHDVNCFKNVYGSTPQTMPENTVMSVVTDDNGYYEFTGLQAGAYQVSEVMQTNWMQSMPGGNGMYGPIVINSGSVSEKNNFGNYIPEYDIKGYKWNDLDGSGEWDQGEPGINGWSINLNEVDGTPIISTTTDEAGLYEFKDLLAGVYQICEVNDEDWYQTYPSENEGCHYVLAGPNTDIKEMHYNFGNTAYGDISGYKFEDLNGNGEWDQEELGLANWTIELKSSCSEVFADYDLVPDDVLNLSDLGLYAQKYGQQETVADLNADGSVNYLDIHCFADVYGATPETMPENTVTTYATLQNGYYEFSGLKAGAYYVSEVMQDGWVQTLPGENGMIGPIVITSGAASMNNNFGNFVPEEEVPNISLVKEITDHDLVPGGFVSYKLTYANTGNVDLTNVYIVDDYPEEYLTISNTGGAIDDSSTLTWTIGDLAIGGTGYVEYTAAIRDTAPANVDIINIATIYSDQTDPKEDDAVTVIPPVEEKNPILQITKDVNVEVVNPGDTVDYTVVVSNVGDGAAINVILTDVLPEGLTYPEGGTTKTFSLGDIEAGDSVTQTYDAVVAESATAGDYVNVATAEADNHDEVSDDATVEVVILLPELEITKEVDVEFANAGDTISYTVVVTNVGEGNAINVILTDTLPEGFVFDGTDEVVKVWNLGDMAPGDSKTITYAVNIKDDVVAGEYENLAITKADNADEKSAKVIVEVRDIIVLGADTLPDTGTSVLDYLYYAIGLITFIIGLWTIQRNSSKKTLVQNHAAKL